MRKRDDQLTVIFLLNRLQCVSFPYIFPTYMEIYCWILIFCFNIMRQYTMFYKYVQSARQGAGESWGRALVLFHSNWTSKLPSENRCSKSSWRTRKRCKIYCQLCYPLSFIPLQCTRKFVLFLLFFCCYQ